MPNQLKSALPGRRVSRGAWVQIGHPAVAEIFARAGFDWVCVDLEHGIIDLETLAGLFRAMGAYDCVPVARLPANDPVWIHRVLDAGARGLIIPMVNSAAEAAAAVREAKYPPVGRRGFGYGRANAYGADFQAYADSANDEIALIVQIEHKDAIAELDAILAVPGVDGAFIGPYDLSGSYGVVGQFDHPLMAQALATFLAACRRHDKAAGIHLVRPTVATIHRAVQDGYSLLALGLDTVFLAEKSAEFLNA